MSEKRLAELRRKRLAWPRGGNTGVAGELLAEIDRLRAEVAALRREPAPLVPDAPGWWWWRERRPGHWSRWAPVLVERHAVTERIPGLVGYVSGLPESVGEMGLRGRRTGEWGGRCEEPRR